MGIIYDPTQDNPVLELAERVSALERMAPAGSTSITTGRFRVASIDGLVVEGQERVTGILVVDGALQVTGTQTVSGTLVIGGGQIINGTFTINGTTTINGNTTYVGDVAVTGTLNLTGTFNVVGGGQIKVGDLTISPSVAAGTGFAAPVRIVLDTPLVEVQSLGVGQSLVVEGNITAPSLPPAPAGSVSNVWRDPDDGQLYKVV
jgi:cytoskeletal protein CcmA (bactofilin family)